MKTTYELKNKSVSAEADGQELEQNALVDTYLALRKVSEKVNNKAIKEVSVNVEQSIEKNYDQALKAEKPEKKKKGSKLPVVLCAIMLIIIVGFGGYTLISQNNAKKLNEEYQVFVSSVNDLCKQAQSEDVDTQAYRDLSAQYYKKGIDTTDVDICLNTVDFYLEDKAKIEALSSPEVSLGSDEYEAVLSEVESNADVNYYVADLRVSIKDIIRQAEDAVSTYKSLKDTILSDTDFDVSKYQSSIDSIVQDAQRNELNAMVKAKEAEVAYNEAVNHLSEVNMPVENEGVKNSKLSKAQRAERDAAIEARDAAVAEAEVAIQTCEENVYNTYCTLYSIQDEMNGTSLLEGYKADWEESHKTEDAESSAE